MNYEVLKNRMLNGVPFLKERAMERINALADNLSITQAEAEELTALAEKNGVEVLPENAMGRLAAVEQTTNDLTLAVAEMIGGAAV